MCIDGILSLYNTCLLIVFSVVLVSLVVRKREKEERRAGEGPLYLPSLSPSSPLHPSLLSQGYI